MDEQFSKWKKSLPPDGYSDQQVWQAAYSLGLAKGRKEGMEEAAGLCQDEQVEDTGHPEDAAYNRTCGHCADAIRQAPQGGENDDKGKTTLTVAKVVEIPAQTADRAAGGECCEWVIPEDAEQHGEMESTCQVRSYFNTHEDVGNGFKFCPYCGKPIHVKES